MTPLPISFASIASAITDSTEETHSEEMFQLVMKTLNSPYINPTSIKLKVGSIILHRSTCNQSIHHITQIKN